MNTAACFCGLPAAKTFQCTPTSRFSQRAGLFSDSGYLRWTFNEVVKQESFQILSSGVVTQQIATDYSDYADKLAVKADSILLSLDDEAFNAGLKAVRCEKSAGPITEPIDYVVFE